MADRLRFLTGLEAILFDTYSKKLLKERSQLHRIIAQNCWLFRRRVQPLLYGPSP
jgi:hypothetical protein